MAAKKPFRTVFAVLAAIVVFSTPSLLASAPPQAQKLLNKARKAIARQKFETAENHLRRLLSQFSDSDLADDAVFWQAYIQEARDRDLTAFQQFAELRQRFPDSEWADNALAHQIRIAQKLYLSGQPQYKQFLTDLLQYDDARIRAEAALSLAELGDSSAVDQVHDFADADDPWLRQRATLALQTVRDGPVPAHPDSERTRRVLLQFQIRAGKIAGVERKKSWRDEFMLYKTRRYRLYETLYERYYADDQEWSLEELVDYGLFHIVPQDEFEQYLALRDPYDRQEWRRIFWKAYDPTPTTPENEFKEEFMRRVIKARAEYGEEWNYRRFRYLRNQYLRSGWSWSPWDSRGELLVKLGEPDYIEPVAFNVDVWYYSREGVSFGVNRYVTNIYGNGYYPDGLYAFIHVGGPGAIEVDYIYNHLMVYDPFPDIELIKGIRIDARPVADNRLMVRIDVPRKRLALIQHDGDRWRLDYLRRLVVFDLDYREILRDEVRHHRSFATRKEAQSLKWLTETVDLELPRGQYILALRIEDRNAPRLGIIKQPIEWR